MIAGKRALGIITARGGSKGIPRKNIAILGGRPLIAWTIAAGRASSLDRLVLSTEDAEIAKVAREWGCEVPFIRPAELALDTTPGVAPVLHAYEQLAEEYDYVVLLQPTSPLRLPEDIDGCVQHCVLSGAPACVSLVPVSHGPEWMYSLDSNSALHPLMQGEAVARRQDMPKCFELNGAVYVAQPEFLASRGTFVSDGTVGFVMPRSRSVDIDDPLDVLVADAIIANGL